MSDDIDGLVARILDEQGLLKRLAAIDRRNPVIDRPRAEAALAEHFARLRLPCPAIYWMRDVEEAARRVFDLPPPPSPAALDAVTAMLRPDTMRQLEEAERLDTMRRRARAARSSAWWEKTSVAVGVRGSGRRGESTERATMRATRRARAWDAETAVWTSALRIPHALGPLVTAPLIATEPMVNFAARYAERVVQLSAILAAGAAPPAAEGMVTILLPFLAAAEAGLWAFWVTERDVVAVARPRLAIENNRLHSASGPAVDWAEGARYWFWRGVRMPQLVVERPQEITVAMIDGEANAEVRRVMIERYRAGEALAGAAAYLHDAGAECLDRDPRFGTLWRREISGDEPIVMLEVEDRTPAPDGTRKHYWLRVDPQLRPLPPGDWPEEQKRAWLAQQQPQEMTAHAAAASLHGKRAADYAPDVET